MLLNTRLKELRKENGITQSELAKSLNVSRSSIAMYENGERIPSYETLEAISDFFNVSILYLLGKESLDYSNEELFKINEKLSDNQKRLLLAIAKQILKSGI